MHDPATGQGQIRLDDVQIPVGLRQGIHVAAENGAFVKTPGSFNSFIHADDRLTDPGAPPGRCKRGAYPEAR
jgi:hypothetical protein